MNRWFLPWLFTVSALTASAQSQVRVLKSHPLHRYGIPAGNYSGICRVGDGHRYLVCDDKTADGFYLWSVDIDTLTGRLRDVRNEGFYGSGLENRDAEDIAYIPETQTVCVVGERDSRVRTYRMDGTPQDGESPVLLPGNVGNSGLEGLTYDAYRQCLWAVEENGGGGRCRLFRLSTQLAVQDTLVYALDAPVAKHRGMVHVHGVSAVCAVSNGGQLLVLEREAFVPRRKIGAWVRCKLYSFRPEVPHEKKLLATWRTRLNLTSRSWANDEGLCLGPQLTDGRQVLLVVSDSQNGYGGVLRDRLRLLLLTI